MTTLAKLKTPVFAVEGIQRPDRASYRLTVGGLGDGERLLSLADLKALPSETVSCRLTSVTGWSVRANWQGVRWTDFMSFANPAPQARYASFTSTGGYTTCVLLSDLAASSSMLVWGVDGEELEDEYGGPLRMIIPNLWGYKSCKWLSRVDFVTQYVPGYWEVRGYSHRGSIEPASIYDVNSGEYREIPGGEPLF